MQNRKGDFLMEERNFLEKLYLCDESFYTDTPLDVNHIYMVRGDLSCTADLYLRGDLYVEGDVHLNNLYLSSAPHNIIVKGGSLSISGSILPTCPLGKDTSTVIIEVPDGDIHITGNVNKPSLEMSCGYAIYIQGNCVVSKITCGNFICEEFVKAERLEATFDIYTSYAYSKSLHAGRDIYLEAANFSGFEELYDVLDCEHGNVFIPQAIVAGKATVIYL